MLISPIEIDRFWNIPKPPHVVHVGAHTAEELELYSNVGWGAVSTTWIEALPNQVDFIKEKIKHLPHHKVIQALAWESSGQQLTFNVSNNVESSSILEFGQHLDVHPHIHVVRSETMVSTALRDLNIWPKTPNVFLNLDIQGAELAALQGLGEKISSCFAIYSEVNVRELYKNVPLIQELDDYLLGNGFHRIDWQIYEEYGWGDALYMRAKNIPSWRGLRRRARVTSRRFS